MTLDPNVKENWEKLQAEYDYPVDAMGRPIDQSDTETLRVWRDEGIDHFMKQ